MTARSLLPVLRQPVRHLNIHEYQSLEIFKEYGIPAPNGAVASTAEEAERIAENITGPDFVVKAQVLSGGRGKGKFSPGGFQGGVHTCVSALEARSLASKMLGQRLVTKQSGAEGKPCNKVWVGQRLYLRRETYFAILMDRQFGGPVMVASPAGGMNIEDVAAATPELIFKEPVDITVGPTEEAIARLAKACGFTGASHTQAADIMTKLYKIFIEKDCTLIEINPMAETHEGNVVCADAKLNFDDNSEFRQKELFTLRDSSQEDPREVSAAEVGLNYIGLDGNIGCLVNGAGLAMASMDAIKLHGGSPANFLDMGGGANSQQVKSAFGILNSDPQVKAILVNIFGGIMRCDVIALGMIQAAQELGIKKPIVIRLAGTNVEAAQQLIDESGLRMLTAGDLGEAASKAVRVVEILDMAQKAKLDVSFEIPL